MATIAVWYDWLESLDKDVLQKQKEALLTLDPLIIKEFEGLEMLITMIDAEITYRRVC